MVRKILLVLGALIGLAVLAAIAIVVLVDVDAHKPRIESAVSDALKMEFRVGGKASLSLFPSPGISLADVRVRNRGTDLARIEAFMIGVKVLPLLRKQVEVVDFVLEKPQVLIQREKDGTLNTETSRPVRKPSQPEEEGSLPALSVRRASIRGGRLVYVDRKDASRIEIDSIDLAGRDLSAGGRDDLLKSLAFSGDLRVKRIKAGDLAVTDIEARFSAADGKIEARPFSMRLFGGRGEGSIALDLSGNVPAVDVRYTLAGFRVEEALSAASRGKFLSGPMTIAPTLAMRGKTAAAMKRSLKGEVSLRGMDLTVHGLDIDEVLSKVEESRKLQLADVGAFLLAGPLGTAATQGLRYGGIYSASRNGESRISRLVSDWTVSGGIAEAGDVAFATTRSRIALKGRLDLPDERFVDVTVAALDGRGCAKVSQRINGPFRNPQVDKVNLLHSAAAPILGLFDRAKTLLTRGACTPFYTGSVAHPGND